MARSFRTVMRGGRSVRATLWTAWASTITSLSAAETCALILVQNAALTALAPFTVVRTRGFFGVRTDQLSADESYDASLGWSVVSFPASAVGVTAVPCPISDQGSDAFFVYETLMGRFNFGDATGSPPQTLTWVQYDSKAMRKVTEDERVVVTIENSAASNGAIVHHQARMLIKLH